MIGQCLSYNAVHLMRWIFHCTTTQWLLTIRINLCADLSQQCLSCVRRVAMRQEMAAEIAFDMLQTHWTGWQDVIWLAMFTAGQGNCSFGLVRFQIFLRPILQKSKPFFLTNSPQNDKEISNLSLYKLQDSAYTLGNQKAVVHQCQAIVCSVSFTLVQDFT